MAEILDKNGLTEEQAIERYRSKNYPKPALTADIVVFTRHENGLRVLLVRRGGHPFIGKLALPGGFADQNEPIESTAARELAEETGVEGLKLELVGVFSAPARDPRGWVVSVAFCAVAKENELDVRAGDDADDALWYSVENTDDGIILHRGDETVRAAELAFDHADILRKALEKI